MIVTQYLVYGLLRQISQQQEQELFHTLSGISIQIYIAGLIRRSSGGLSFYY